MRAQRGQTLVASLIVIAIILVLAVVLLRGSGAFTGAPASNRADGKGTTVVGAVRYEAKDEVCKSNLGQVRQAIQIAAPLDEDFPATLQDTKLPSEFYACPIGKEPYQYDPATGVVRCPHPGHEKY